MRVYHNFNNRPWSEAENHILRGFQHKTSEWFAEHLPDRSQMAIRNQKRKLGLPSDQHLRMKAKGEEPRPPKPSAPKDDVDFGAGFAAHNVKRPSRGTPVRITAANTQLRRAAAC